MNWAKNAACLDADIAIFFPTAGDAVVAYEIAAMYCARCPVLAECRDENDRAEGNAISYLHGFYAGETPLQRAERRRSCVTS